MYSPTGKNADPEFRRARARLASEAANSTDALIGRLARRAPEFTEAQRAELARLAELVDSDGGR